MDFNFPLTAQGHVKTITEECFRTVLYGIGSGWFSVVFVCLFVCSLCVENCVYGSDTIMQNVIRRFDLALFSVFEQTHCARM